MSCLIKKDTNPTYIWWDDFNSRKYIKSRNQPNLILSYLILTLTNQSNPKELFLFTWTVPTHERCSIPKGLLYLQRQSLWHYTPLRQATHPQAVTKLCNACRGWWMSWPGKAAKMISGGRLHGGWRRWMASLGKATIMTSETPSWL